MKKKKEVGQMTESFPEVPSTIPPPLPEADPVLNAVKPKLPRYVYDACCSGCGVKHGEVHFDAPQPNWNPRDAGIACSGCVKEGV